MVRRKTTPAQPKPGESTQMKTADQRVHLVRGMLHTNTAEIERALAQRVPIDLFLRVCMTTFRAAGDKMLSADPRTFIAACVEAAQLGLLPDGHLGEAYLIPVWDKNHINADNSRGATVVQLRIGYPGMMKLARRSGDVKDIQAECVFANDEFDVVLGTDRRIRHVPWYARSHKIAEPGPVVAAYATAEIVGSQTLSFQVVPKRDLDATAERSGNPKDREPSTFWKQHPEAMSKKTAVRRLCKWLPIPDDARAAMNRDLAREEGREIIDVGAREDGPKTLNDLIGNGTPPPVPPSLPPPTEPDRGPDPPPPEDES